MKFKDTPRIIELKEEFRKKMELRVRAQQEENTILSNLIRETSEMVCEKFKDFKDGELVMATWYLPRGPYDVETRRKVFFHTPVKMQWLNGAAACDYEIRFRAVNNDGSECKRDDLMDYHVPVYRLINIEKIKI